MGISSRLRRVLAAFGLIAAIGLRCAPMQGQGKVPELHGKSFTDQPVNLPRDLQGKVGVLVIGFTQGSRDAVTAWAKRLATDYYDSPAVAYYNLPVTAAVPKFMRGYVTSKIRESVSDRGRPHFVPITEDEAGWKALTHYQHGDDAYVVVVDGEGKALWQTHDPFSETTYAGMKARVEESRSAIAHSGQ